MPYSSSERTAKVDVGVSALAKVLPLGLLVVAGALVAYSLKRK